jgi:hypothetical protein
MMIKKEHLIHWKSNNENELQTARNFLALLLTAVKIFAGNVKGLYI